MSDFLSAAREPSVERRVEYKHVLGPPVDDDVINSAWHSRCPSLPLPQDLRELLRRCNGIHLWANAETGRAYTGIAPIEEWDLARAKIYGPGADPKLLDDRFIAISYHQDGAAFVTLEVNSGAYFLMDAAGPDETAPIGKNVADMLDWLWTGRFIPGARQEDAPR